MDSSQSAPKRDTKTSSQPLFNPSWRREKPQLSCNPCRRRKSRCDRKRPCSLCSTRGQTCTYPENGSTVAGPSRTALTAPSNTHDRLVQLERLVMSVMSNSTAVANVHAKTDVQQMVPTPTDTMPEDIPREERSECGSMKISASELRYIGGDHWVAILEGIADLKDHVDREEQFRLAESPGQIADDPEKTNGDSSAPGRDGAFLLYGRCRLTSRDDILSALPPRYAVDRYISRYFNYLDLVSAAAVHGPVFLREYEAFWANPSAVPIIWLGLLFSMICLACLASNQHDNPDTESLSLQIDLYREKIVQCLIMGEYTKSGPYVLETVINYIYAEFCVCTDANRDMWYLLAMEVNLAMRTGYHRDPSRFPGISPFQGEMRRRVWATVLMSDIMISNQMGMPRMISDWKCDTAEPRNLNDADFDEDTKELPPPRPENELTTALAIIARRRMLKALGIIADLTSRVKPCSYEEVMQVDRILHDAAASIPAPLKWKPMTASVTDSPQLIIARLFIRHMLYKGQIMLHQRFLGIQSSSDKQDGFDYSRQACIDASTGTLELQNVLDEETCAGGQLHEMRWRVTSMMNHQFLTAAMILCSLLHNGRAMEREDEIQRALQRARGIWMRTSSTSKEAKRAADIVGLVLSRTEGGGISDSKFNPNAGSDFAVPDASCDFTVVPNDPVLGNMSFHDPEQFIMPGILGDIIPPVLEHQDMSYNGHNTAPSDGWMFMHWDNPGI
ncbi:fungal-specific transcription factor domain-domain-containing protein [Aspergillus taichungensis]|uniref:Fungal-specific transcription factor domain-domain-containing protein n=1 Tax=Aspergillus taichungensis TaxID=482145 RepID=A0A2J5HH03_9EURO|nr:fungal-specific transcription factor domain-domain-containing protein [Aspergillus taichungensis]